MIKIGHNDNNYTYSVDGDKIAYWDDNKIMWILFKEFEDEEIIWLEDYPNFKGAFSEAESLEIMKTDRYKKMYGR